MRSGLRLMIVVGLGVALATSTAWAGEEQPPDAPQDTLFGGAYQRMGGPLVQIGGGLGNHHEHGVDIKGITAPFTLHIGGLIQWDYGGPLQASPALEAAAGQPWKTDGELRRGRFRLEGSFLKAFHYRVRYNFGRNAGFQDLYVDWSRPYDEWDGFLPRIRFGQVREPMSIEELTGSRWITFLEPALPVQAFAPGRNPGIRLQASPFSQHVTWWFGVFAPNAANLGEVDTGSGLATTGRLTWLALAPREDRSRLLSLGAAASLRYGLKEERFRTNTGLAQSPMMLDTGKFAAHHSEVFQLELAFVHDRFSLQTEIFYAHTTPKAASDIHCSGGYGQVSYFLTEPGRRFNRHTAVFSRVKPPRAVVMGQSEGFGAFEVAARYSFVDLQGDDISGGMASQVTLGLNWYPTAWTRITLNYIYNAVTNAYGVESADGTIQQLGVRFQVDF